MDFTHEELKVLQEAIDRYGEESQFDMAIKEMAELTKSICEYKSFSKGSVVLGLLKAEDIVKEIADLLVMLEQLMMIFDCKQRVSAIAREKIRRLKARIDNDV